MRADIETEAFHRNLLNSAFACGTFQLYYYWCFVVIVVSCWCFVVHKVLFKEKSERI